MYCFDDEATKLRKIREAAKSKIFRPLRGVATCPLSTPPIVGDSERPSMKSERVYIAEATGTGATARTLLVFGLLPKPTKP